MTTQSITVGETPVQITDGTNSALISVKSRYGVRFADSSQSPDTINYDFLNDKMIVSPPLKVWIWSGNQFDADVAVTKW